jgi:hypothetical protein
MFLKCPFCTEIECLFISCPESNCHKFDEISKKKNNNIYDIKLSFLDAL